MDPRLVAEEYLEEHKICQLFETITAQVLFHKPDNPKKFIIQLLQNAKSSPQTPALLTEDDFRTMFAMLDITKRGVVTKEQASNALISVMGPSATFESTGLSEVPAYLKEDDFISNMKQAVKAVLPYNYDSKGLLPRFG